MAIKDGLNWLRKQATQAPSLSNWDRDVPYWQQGVKPPFSEDDYIAQANQKAYQDSLAERQRQEVLSRFPKPVSPAELAAPTNPLDLQATTGYGSAPSPAVDRMVDTNNASPAGEVDAGADALPSDAAEGNPMPFDAAEFGQPAPQQPQQTPAPSPTTAATGDGALQSPAVDRMVDTNNASPAGEVDAGADALPSDAAEGNPMPFDAAEFGQPAPQQPQQTPAPQQPQQQAPAQGGQAVNPAVASQGFVSDNTGNSTAQTQAMPNGSADYSRIFGKGFNAASGSASDKWLAGQADKLRAAGYSDNQISTMLDVNAWRKYGRRGQDYQVNTKRYTRPMGMKSASASDELWSKQAGLNDDLDDLYVRRLRVGLWDKYNG